MKAVQAVAGKTDSFNYLTQELYTREQRKICHLFHSTSEPQSVWQCHLIFPERIYLFFVSYAHPPLFLASIVKQEKTKARVQFCMHLHYNLLHPQNAIILQWAWQTYYLTGINFAKLFNHSITMSKPQPRQKDHIDPQGCQQVEGRVNEGVDTCCHGKWLRFSHQVDQNHQPCPTNFDHQQSKGWINAVRGDWADSGVWVWCWWGG